MKGQPHVVLKGDHAIVRDAVRRHAASFAAHGYELASIKLDQAPGLPDYPVFLFLNEKTGMEIDLSYGADATGRKAGFVVLIKKPKQGTLDVEDWLMLQEREDLAKLFTDRSPRPDVRAFANNFLRMLTGLLDTDLKPMVDGTNFQETPIDWMGLR